MVHVVFVWDKMPRGSVGSWSREESRHLLRIACASERSLPAGLCFTVDCVCDAHLMREQGIDNIAVQCDKDDQGTRRR